jgi:E3 ubiquitin-protein ligase HECTD1
MDLYRFVFYLETIRVKYFNHLLMTNVCEKAISILAGNLNQGLSYLSYYNSIYLFIFLGRAALPKSLTPNSGGRLSVLRRLDSSGERTHRQLIDCIRSKDTGKSIKISL